jgi:signal transduction histidine kinase
MMKPAPFVSDIQNFAEDIVNTVREPLLILDTALRVRFANRAFYKTFQVSPAETEAHLIYELGNGQWDIPELRTLLEEIVPQSSVFNDFELTHTFPVIGCRVMLLNARRLRTAEHTELLVLALEDVTERRRVHDLEMRFTAELQASYNRLQELERLREELTNMIVHDLRTPLTSIIAGMQTIGAAGELNEVQQEVTTIALSGGQTLLGMINNLLDVEKMESGEMKLNYALLSVSDLVTNAIGQVALLAESKNQTLVQQIAPDLKYFRGDENMLVRTLVNLLGNAVKFTPDGGILTIAGRQDNGNLLLSVSDTGDGIPAACLDRIFEKFGQVESRRGGNKMGTGLGLTFCKLVAEAHGGDLKVKSTPGQGSTFTLAMPLAWRGPLSIIGTQSSRK